MDINHGKLITRVLRNNITLSLWLYQTGGISLYLINNSQPLPLVEDPEFIVGRELTDLEKGEGVDLASFGGYENGVSKQHAMIRRTENHYEIIDLIARTELF